MSLSSYNPSARYRDKAMNRMANVLATLMIVVVSAAIGFWMGRQYGAESVVSLKNQVQTLTQQNGTLQDSVTELRAEAQTANTRYEQLKQEYNEQIPEGPMRDITSLIREQLKQGMDPERLSFVVRSARPPTGCTEPETKRFVLSTPASTGPESSMSVADGTVTITGSGTSAVNSGGNPEAWFDPAQPVAIRFKAGALSETKNGTLPLRHSVVVEGREYRFTVEEGSRSFVRVVYDSCAYP